MYEHAVDWNLRDRDGTPKPLLRGPERAAIVRRNRGGRSDGPYVLSDASAVSIAPPRANLNFHAVPQTAAEAAVSSAWWA